MVFIWVNKSYEGFIIDSHIFWSFMFDMSLTRKHAGQNESWEWAESEKHWEQEKRKGAEITLLGKFSFMFYNAHFDEEFSDLETVFLAEFRQGLSTAVHILELALACCSASV